METRFIFKKTLSAVADPRLDNTTIKDIVRSSCLGEAEITFAPGEANTLTVGTPCEVPLPSGKEFVFSVSKDGIFVRGENYGGLVRGFLAMFLKTEVLSVEAGKEAYAIPFCEEESQYTIKNRMMHVCVLPENKLSFFKKTFRLAAACQYTHIVIESWGTIKLDCFPELSWPNAFSKAEIKTLIEELRHLGIEPIPMLNHLGHATASRMCVGKHVVLDQNPKLYHLFTHDGWSWDIKSEEVLALLKQVRLELYEIFGEGEYFHLGFDEAYSYTSCKELNVLLPDYFKKITEEILKENRRPMIWMDMLLEKDKYKDCYCTAAPEEVAALMSAISPKTILVDWQYEIQTAPIPTLQSLTDSSFDVIGAPWFEEKNIDAHVSTIASEKLFGIMLTTWNTLRFRMHTLYYLAKLAGASFPTWCQHGTNQTVIAALLRKMTIDFATYEAAGWIEDQLEP